MPDPKQVVRQGYDAVSLAYRCDQVDDATERKYASWISLLHPLVPDGGRVLDLGCGCGLPATRLLARRYDVTAVDFSPVQIARARKLVPHATFHCADITGFPLPPDSYDAVVSLYALIHIPVGEQPELIGRITAALRPGGALLIITGHRAWTGTQADWLGVPGAPMYWSHEDEDAYRRWIIDAGLKILSAEFVPEGQDGHTLFLAIKPLTAVAANPPFTD